VPEVPRASERNQSGTTCGAVLGAAAHLAPAEPDGGLALPEPLHAKQAVLHPPLVQHLGQVRRHLLRQAGRHREVPPAAVQPRRATGRGARHQGRGVGQPDALVGDKEQEVGPLVRHPVTQAAGGGVQLLRRVRQVRQVQVQQPCGYMGRRTY
jgi:hypothetical protein